jgi:hypothetical protein
MAEFCLKCFNEMNDTKLTDKEVFLEDDLCEGCGKIKPCVIAIKKEPQTPFKSILKWLGIK